MDKERAVSFIENSFLSTLVTNKDVTDISFNGQDIYYVSNSKGRCKSKIVIEHQVAKDFIRQVANIAEKQFSFTSPVLDTSIGRYRINATHQSIGRIMDEGVLTFSIRIASSEERINRFSDFFTKDIVELIKTILDNHQSIVIGGLTSSGKTEFQKFLLKSLKENERVIVIDNVMELDQVRNEYLDLTCWQVDTNNEYTSSSLLIRNALRNNPDWLILAEARGAEMVDVLSSAMTGLPIITTIHSRDCQSLPYRMGRMMMQSTQKIDYKEALNDIRYHFHYFFYLKKEIKDKKVKRFISEINFVNDNGKTYQIYKRNGNEHTYNYLPVEALNMLENYENLKGTKFIKEDKNEK